MKTKLLTSLLVLAACFAGSARGQTVQSATQAPSATEAAPAAPAPNQTVYTQRLPAVDELSKAAAAQGLTVERIEQNPSQITVVYRLSNGQTNTVAYLLLPGNNGATTQAPAQAQVVAPATQAPTVYVPAPQTQTVYYASPAPSVVYYDDYPRYYSSYYPRYYYPPVSIGLGFGFRSGGYYHGGFHGGYRGSVGFHHR